MGSNATVERGFTPRIAIDFESINIRDCEEIGSIMTRYLLYISYIGTQFRYMSITVFLSTYQ
jgi:hypothetical protein